MDAFRSASDSSLKLLMQGGMALGLGTAVFTLARAPERGMPWAETFSVHRRRSGHFRSFAVYGPCHVRVVPYENVKL